MLYFCRYLWQRIENFTILVMSKLIKFRIAAFFLIVTYLFSCQAQREIAVLTCDTKYPVILAHGIFLRDDIRILRYWNSIPKVLEKNGAKVFLANTDAIASHFENALQLREKVIEVLDETGAEKVNIIAHSKGGLEARYMISKLDMADQVASLTTLATPHWGSYHADTIIHLLAKWDLTDKVVNLLKFYARFTGDKSPDPFLAGTQLTYTYLKDFNQSVVDMPQVYYQSYGGLVNMDYPSGLIRMQSRIVSEKEGDNDCVVAIGSYKWGNFRGVVKGDQDFGVSHFDIIGIKVFSKQSTFDAKAFMVELVKDLKERGY
jgi:triacylglycerol lipase